MTNLPKKRRLWKKVLLSVLALPLAVMLIATAANCFDESLHVQTAEMLAPRTGSLPDEKNLYLAILGINGPINVPIAQAGRFRLDERERRMAAFVHDSGHFEPPPFEPPDRLEPVGDFAWCNNTAPNMWQESTEELGARLSPPANNELLRRYFSLQSFPDYLDVSNPGLVADEPYVRGYARCLFLAQEVLAFKGGLDSSKRAAVELLHDIAVWRLMLRQSDYFLGKLIAAANLRSDFSILVMAESQNSAITPVISRLIAAESPWTSNTDWELSAAFRRSAVKSVYLLNAYRTAIPPRPVSFTDRLNNAIVGHFFKETATMNLICDAELRLTRASQVDLSKLEASVADAQAWIGTQTYALAPRMLYNPVGRILSGISTWVDADMPVELADSRTFEALARLVLEAHQQGVHASDMPQFMATHPSLATNPVTGQQFAYDAATQTVSFEPRFKRQYPMRSSLPL